MCYRTTVHARDSRFLLSVVGPGAHLASLRSVEFSHRKLIILRKSDMEHHFVCLKRCGRDTIHSLNQLTERKVILNSESNICLAESPTWYFRWFFCTSNSAAYQRLDLSCIMSRDITVYNFASRLLPFNRYFDVCPPFCRYGIRHHLRWGWNCVARHSKQTRVCCYWPTHPSPGERPVYEGQA